MKPMPKLGQRFANEVNQLLLIASGTEALWLNAPPASQIRKQLKVPQLEALYEATYLRIFASWEIFIENVIIYWMANYGNTAYVPQPATGRALYKSLTDARITLYDNNDYLLWHNANTVVKRTKKHLDNCPVEALFLTAKTDLENYSNIRHRIAHDSKDAVSKFKAAAIKISGSEQKGRAGHLLRAAKITDPLNQPKWIRVIADDLISFALQITP